MLCLCVIDRCRPFRPPLSLSLYCFVDGDRVRALAPRLYEARSAPSWVAIGTTYSRLAYSPLTCPSIPKSQYRFAMICLRCVLPNYLYSSTRQHSGSLEEKECSWCHLCTVYWLAAAFARAPSRARLRRLGTSQCPRSSLCCSWNRCVWLQKSGGLLIGLLQPPSSTLLLSLYTCDGSALKAELESVCCVSSKHSPCVCASVVSGSCRLPHPSQTARLLRSPAAHMYTVHWRQSQRGLFIHRKCANCCQDSQYSSLTGTFCPRTISCLRPNHDMNEVKYKMKTCPSWLLNLQSWSHLFSRSDMQSGREKCRVWERHGARQRIDCRPKGPVVTMPSMQLAGEKQFDFYIFTHLYTSLHIFTLIIMIYYDPLYTFIIWYHM